MLAPAILYKDELHKIMAQTCWFNEKYKYFNRGYESFDEIVDSTEKQHQFVSINKEGKICGLFFYYVDRHTRSVCGINAASFDVDPVVFGLDVKRAIEDIFTKFNFHKMCFGVVVGNPIEPTYDKLCAKMGGRVVGYYRDDAMLMDGSYADIKVYEVMRDEYLASRNKNKHTTSIEVAYANGLTIELPLKDPTYAWNTNNDYEVKNYPEKEKNQ